MKAVVILVGVLALILTICIMATRVPPTEEQVRAERQAQAEKLEATAMITDLIVNSVTADGNITKSGMNKLRKIVSLYKDIPLYKQAKKTITDPSKYPSHYLLTTVERITNLYFPSLGHSCEKECLEQVRFLFNQLGADVKTVEPNTGPRDILIGAIVGFAAILFFFYRLIRDIYLRGKLQERLDKEKAST